MLTAPRGPARPPRPSIFPPRQPALHHRNGSAHRPVVGADPEGRWLPPRRSTRGSRVTGPRTCTGRRRPNRTRPGCKDTGSSPTGCSTGSTLGCIAATKLVATNTTNPTIPSQNSAAPANPTITSTSPKTSKPTIRAMNDALSSPCGPFESTGPSESIKPPPPLPTDISRSAAWYLASWRTPSAPRH